MDKHHYIKSLRLPKTTLYITNEILPRSTRIQHPLIIIIRYLFSYQAVDHRPSASHVSSKLHSLSSFEASFSNSYFNVE